MKNFIKSNNLLSILILNIFLINTSLTFLCKDPTQFLQFLPDYEIKIHKVTTSDGYNLNMFQIFPNSSKNSLLKILDNGKTFKTSKKGNNY